MAPSHEEFAKATPCSACGYDLRGLTVGGQCPECGIAIARTVPPCPRCRISGSAVALVRPPHRPEGPKIAGWRCPVCRGFGFDEGELRKALSQVLNRQPGNLAGAPAGARKEHNLIAQMPVKCGRCDGPCRAIVVDGHTLIDRCDSCGFVWLDADELGSVVKCVRRFFDAEPLPRHLEKILDDIDAMAKESSRRRGKRDGVFGDSVADAVAMLVDLLLCLW